MHTQPSLERPLSQDSRAKSKFPGPGSSSGIYGLIVLIGVCVLAFRIDSVLGWLVTATVLWALYRYRR
jgi:hypothetical protein